MLILVADHLKKVKKMSNQSEKILKLTDGAGSQLSGSINRLLALGADDAEPICLRIEFGPGTLPDSNFTPSSVIETVQVPAGTYIEGPIGRVSGSGFLAYLNR